MATVPDSALESALEDDCAVLVFGLAPTGASPAFVSKSSMIAAGRVTLSCSIADLTMAYVAAVEFGSSMVRTALSIPSVALPSFSASSAFSTKSAVLGNASIVTCVKVYVSHCKPSYNTN